MQQLSKQVDRIEWLSHTREFCTCAEFSPLTTNTRQTTRRDVMYVSARREQRKRARSPAISSPVCESSVLATVVKGLGECPCGRAKYQEQRTRPASFVHQKTLIEKRGALADSIGFASSKGCPLHPRQSVQYTRGHGTCPRKKLTLSISSP